LKKKLKEVKKNETEIEEGNNKEERFKLRESLLWFILQKWHFRHPKCSGKVDPPVRYRVQS
jgi:hypothetical protein